MWYWDPTDPNNPTPSPTGANGPHGPINFTFNFSLPFGPEPGGQYGAWIAADDFMSLFINGIGPIQNPTTPEGGLGLDTSYILDNHKGPDNQPIPVFIDFTSALQVGTNTITITACDGNFPTCQDRAYEWAFIDAEHGPDQPPAFITAPAPMPEPSSMSLLGVAALAGWAFRKRLFSKKQA
jgi:hypothetical protein